MVGDDRLKKVDDLLLSRGCGVEFTAHLDESPVDMFTEGAELRPEGAEVRPEGAELRPEVNEVFPEGIEACRRGLAEVTEIISKFADVAVGGSCEYAGGRGVMLACLHSPGQVAHLVLKSGDA